MPPKKKGSGGGGASGGAASTHTVTLDVLQIFNDEKIDQFVSVHVPFVTKSKIGKCIQGKADKESRQPQIGTVDLLLPDGKKVKVKNPGKNIEAGEKYVVTITHPPKDVAGQLAEGAAAAQGMEDERVKKSGDIDAALRSLNTKLEEKKVPKNSWMHKDGGERAKASDREHNVIGHISTVGPEN